MVICGVHSCDCALECCLEVVVRGRDVSGGGPVVVVVAGGDIEARRSCASRVGQCVIDNS